ncbi:MFS general substrate transporter [Hortaea werneckii]|nr:MFS general substrate transporter [Hortaea werneckii]
MGKTEEGQEKDDDYRNEESSDTDQQQPSLDEKGRNGPPDEPSSKPSQPQPSEHEDEEEEPNVVNWDGPNDPHNPRNWPTKAKIFNLLLVILLTLLTPLASSMFAPGVPEVLQDFRTGSTTLAEFVVSIYILGFAIGPLLISPMSEMYGRIPVYIVCNVMFEIFTVACAVSSSLNQLIVFRFFAGCFGVCPVTLGGASISDLMDQDKRGVAMSLFGMGPLLGPVIGPVAGAYLAAAEGWRWTFWLIAIAVSGLIYRPYTSLVCLLMEGKFGVCAIAHAALCRETYAPVLLARKTKRLQKETGNQDLRSKLDDGLPNKTRFSRAMVRPFKMLLFSPIVSLMALYVAFVYGILYLLYTTFTFVFQQYYGFSDGDVGLTYIASGIGMFIGLFLIGGSSDRILKRLAAKHGGELKPEYRLIPLMFTAWTIPVGLFIYGWTAQYNEQWAVPLFGTLLFGVGMIAALICVQQYLIDAFTIYAASAVAANTVLRSIVGGVLPLAGLSMYDALGLGWGNSLLAFIALAMVPIPFAFYIWGEKFRKRPISL